MSAGKMQVIHDRELDQRRRAVAYLLGGTLGIVVVIAAVVVAIMAIAHTI